MKIAILSDIHANLYALKVVLKQCAQQNIDYYFILGDSIGYYHQPKEVIELIETLNFCMVKGNHEEFLERILNEELSLASINEKYGTGIEKAMNDLNDSQIRNLTNCPYELVKNIDGLKIKLIHGDYLNWENYFYPDSPMNQLNTMCEGDYDFVFLGHSHYSFSYFINGTTLVNVGSVGQNKSYGGIANWAVLNTISKTVTMNSAPYDVHLLIDDIMKRDTSNKEFLISVLSRNN